MNRDENLEKAKNYKEEGRYEEAIELLEQLQKNDPADTVIYQQLIDTLFSYGNYLNDEYVLEYEKAKKVFKKILKMEPENYRALYNLGVVYFNLNENDKALDKFQQALKIKPNYKYCYYNMGLLHESLNEYEKALEYYEKALSIDKNFVYADQARKMVRDILDELKENTS
ncbi:MAG: tetratricopeptide repeat protein [Promethearchaeota archaeon]